MKNRVFSLVASEREIVKGKGGGKWERFKYWRLSRSDCAKIEKEQHAKYINKLTGVSA